MVCYAQEKGFDTIDAIDDSDVVPYAVIENVPVYKGCDEGVACGTQGRFVNVVGLFRCKS